MSKRKRRPKPKSLVDVIIPVHGRLELLKSCLDALPLAFGDIKYSIYLFDNGTPKEDEPDLFYSQDFGEIRPTIIKYRQNLGFPKACNMAARKGRSPLIFFLNSDVILAPGSMDYLVKEMDDPKLGVAGMKLLFPTHEQLINANLRMDIRPAQKVQHVGLVTNIVGHVMHLFLGWSSNNPKVATVAGKEMLAVTGAALMTRRVVFSKARGFLEDYGMGTYEDVDYCLLARKIGYNVRVVPDAVGVHYTGASSEKYKTAFPLNRNYQIFLSRWANELEQWDWRVL